MAALAVWVWNGFVRQAQTALNANPVVIEHIGRIDQIDSDWKATGDAEGDDVFAFRVSGKKGSGLVVAEFETVDADTEELRGGSLTLASGEKFQLK
jgi:hypothetical protein